MGIFGSGLNLGGQITGLQESGLLNQPKSGGFNAFMSSVGQGAASGGMDMGATINGALDAAASMIPFGGIAKKVLDSLGLQENINLVSKYGISSWGASTSPEAAKALIAKNVQPYIEEKMASINVSNVSQVINEVEDILLANHYFFAAMRDNHSKAKSTRMANEMTQKEFKSIADKFTSTIKAEFKKYNVTFTRTSSRETGRQLAESGKIYNLKDNKSWVGGPNRDLDRYLAKQYYNWNVDFSKMKGLKADKDGNISKSSGSSSLLAIGGAVFAAFKMFK